MAPQFQRLHEHQELVQWQEGDGKECGRALPHRLPVSRSRLSLLCCNSETEKCFLEKLFQATRRLSSPQRPEYVLKEAHLRHPIHKTGSSLGTQAQVQSSILKSSRLQFELRNEPLSPR